MLYFQYLNIELFFFVNTTTELVLTQPNHAQGWWGSKEYLEKSQPKIANHMVQWYHMIKFFYTVSSGKLNVPTQTLDSKARLEIMKRYRTTKGTDPKVRTAT